MGLFQTLRDATRRQSRRIRKTDVVQEFRNALYSSPVCSDYENVFAQVRPLIDAMVMVRPYGVGGNGARLAASRTPELNALDDPNEDMGAIEFFDTMFATWLTEDNLYIHVHRKKNGSVIGYTLLPPDSKVTVTNGQPYWQIWTSAGMQTFYRDEVMELHYSRNPRTLRGVSPAGAVRTYAQIDDLFAQFEKAWLENGAIPASVTIIRASTQAKFNEARAELESQLKGAHNRNKTLYLWRQFNNDDGSEKDQVEVKTIQGNNNTMAIREIVDVINDRLNKAYGVSNFIMGDDSSAKYDNAELSDFQFTRRRVKPALVKFWSQFQHELDRITGGLGYAIDFHLDEPELTERKKVEAETDEKITQNLIRLLEAGARPSEACKALDLSIDKWLNVAVGIYSRVLADKEAERSLAVAQSQQKQKTPAKSENFSISLSDSHCQHSHDEYKPFADDEVVEKKIFDRLMALARAIFKEDPSLDLIQVQDEIFELLEDEANRGGLAALEAIEKLVDDETEEAIKEIIKNGGNQISEQLSERLRQRSDYLVTGFDKHTREVMRSVLETEEPLTANEIRERLEAVLPYSKASTIARNETVYAFKSGRLELDEQIAQKYDLVIELTWRTSPEAGDVCPLCEAMDGKKTLLGKAFTPVPVEVEKKDGTTEIKSWTPSEWNDNGCIPNAHTNCKCYFDETLVRTA